MAIVISLQEKAQERLLQTLKGMPACSEGYEQRQIFHNICTHFGMKEWELKQILIDCDYNPLRVGMWFKYGTCEPALFSEVCGRIACKLIERQREKARQQC